MNPELDASKRPVFAFRDSVVTAETELTLPALQAAHALTGPAPKAGAQHTCAARGDLAHVRYAGQIFVSHYVVPVPRTIGDAGANLHVAGRADTEVVATLGAGETFNLLDVSGGWGWGQQGEDGFVGYLPMTALAE